MGLVHYTLLGLVSSANSHGEPGCGRAWVEGCAPCSALSVVCPACSGLVFSLCRQQRIFSAQLQDLHKLIKVCRLLTDCKACKEHRRRPVVATTSVTHHALCALVARMVLYCVSFVINHNSSMMNHYSNDDH